jgi:hypothetical protein
MDVLLYDNALLAVLSIFYRKLKNIRVFCHGITLCMMCEKCPVGSEV